MTNYSRGRRFEYDVRDDMASYGFIAIRSPASKTPADVYCIRRDMVVFVQCKTDGRLPPKKWNEFMDYCERVGAVPVIAMKGNKNRGRVYKLMTGRKDGSRKPQPMVDWIPPSEE